MNKHRYAVIVKDENEFNKKCDISINSYGKEILVDKTITWERFRGNTQIDLLNDPDKPPHETLFSNGNSVTTYFRLSPNNDDKVFFAIIPKEDGSKLPPRYGRNVPPGGLAAIAFYNNNNLYNFGIIFEISFEQLVTLVCNLGKIKCITTIDSMILFRLINYPYNDEHGRTGVIKEAYSTPSSSSQYYDYQAVLSCVKGINPLIDNNNNTYHTNRLHMENGHAQRIAILKSMVKTGDVGNVILWRKANLHNRNQQFEDLITDEGWKLSRVPGSQVIVNACIIAVRSFITSCIFSASANGFNNERLNVDFLNKIVDLSDNAI